MVQGESVKVELLTADGWQDITDCTGEIEIESSGDGLELAGWVPDEVTLTIEEWKEYVKVASGKYIAVRPRLG